MASKGRTLSFSERHQQLVDRNYHKMLHLKALNKIESQIRDQIVRNENDDRADRKRFLRLLQDEQFELDMEEAIQKAEENKRLRELQFEQEEKLAVELAKLKHESLKDEKMRQQVKENSIELRELEKKLKAAYMNKERAAQIAEKDAIKYEQMLIEKLGQMLQQRDDLEQVRQELYQEEQAEIQKRKLKEEAEEKLRKQKELKQNFTEQMALKELVLQAAKEEEETFRKAMLAKLAEDDRIELMNAHKRRMKQLEHGRAVEKLIEERKKFYLHFQQRELEEWQLQQSRQGRINAIIEEERLKLLQEHATKLLGYLPKGVFKTEGDIDMLGEEFKKAYQKRSEICEEK
ncbi:PREDICTED: meiosis-specific nuclear structural protein 1 [Myotis davidii]|uniref:meiosis-specific nuclear structural protein 1 n=1 Tax=Myotis davidii TaxID=225400 RepID=UPI00076745E3|nr:PREDICTED: meiosis-specific nuclear structural protein 1 [Myotis davidii]